MNMNEWVAKLGQAENKQVLASLKVGGQKVDVCTCAAKKTESGFEIVKTAGSLEIKLQAKTYADDNAVEWVVWLKNGGNENTPELSEIWAADISAEMDRKVKLAQVGINGDRCNEENFLPYRHALSVGSKRRVTPNGGRPSNGEFPYFDLQDKQGGAIVAIGWSGQWLYELERTEEALKLRVGLEDACFYLKPGEEVRLPRVLMKGFEGDPVDGHNAYRRLIFQHYSPKKADGSPMYLPAAIQCFDRYTYRLDRWNTEEGQKEYAAYAKKLQYLDTVWLDAAWFTGGFPYGVGNYTFRKGFPNGLRPVSDETRRLGMKFLLWFEPERIAYGTQMDREHPEWVIKDPNEKSWGKHSGRSDEDLADPVPSGLYNLGIPEAQKFLSDRLIAFIRKEGIDSFRQDFNIDPLKFWRLNDEPGRKGLSEIKYVMGFYRLWDDLRETFPDMLIDNCASGGRRIDLETCSRAVPLWRSDTGCSPIGEDTPSDMWNQNQSISLSHYLAYHSIAAWNAGAYEFRSAATNGMACNFDVFNPEFDFEEATECLKEFDRLKNYWLGDFYPITPATLDDTTWSAFQLHCGKCGNGMLMVFRRAHSPYECATFKLRGVDESAQYQLIIADENRKLTEETVSGAQLAEGYTVKLNQTRSSVAIEYKKL